MASETEAAFVKAGFAANMRADGRAREQYRQIDVATNFLAQCNGSARVQLGATDVVAGVKVELAAPDVQQQCGRIDVGVVSSAVADAGNQGRGSLVKDAAMEAALNDMLQGPLGAKGVGLDLTKLLIAKDKKCWNIFVDCVVLNDDGNAMDALALAVKAALSRTGLPRVEVANDATEGARGELQVDTEDTVPVDAANVPVIVTIQKADASSVVDCTASEAAAVADMGVQVAIDKDIYICGINKLGNQGMDPSVLLAMLHTTQRLGPALITALNAQLQREEEAEGEDEGDAEMDSS